MDDPGTGLKMAIHPRWFPIARELAEVGFGFISFGNFDRQLTNQTMWTHMRILLDVLHRDSHSRATRSKLWSVETRRRHEDDCGEPDYRAVCRMPGNKIPVATADAKKFVVPKNIRI
ncbi:hypothetical protein [Nitrospira sp. Nam74]